MLAALITGKDTVELREFPDPTPASTGVVVDIAFCGICGTDVHAYQSGRPYNPAICGHEWSGTVSAIGAEVSSFSEGDRVVVAVAPSCGRCTACHRGQTDRCEVTFLSALGRDPLAPPHGGFAPRIAVAAARVVKTDPALTDEQAAQVEPTTVAFHAVRTSALRLGDIAVIQGAGPIGLGTMQWVRAAGAGQVIVVEPNEQRRALALELGAHLAVAPGEEADQAIRERTHGLGADIVYECVGRPFAVQSAVDLAPSRGSDVPDRPRRQRRVDLAGGVVDQGDLRDVVARVSPRGVRDGDGDDGRRSRPRRPAPHLHRRTRRTRHHARRPGERNERAHQGARRPDEGAR